MTEKRLIDINEKKLTEINEITPTISKSIKSKGKQILQENDFFADLDYIMSDNSFRSFYSKYFKDYTDIKTVLLYMKLYETIQVEYKERHNKDIDKELLAYMMKELMCNENSRKKIVESFNNFIENTNNGNKKFILDIIKN